MLVNARQKKYYDQSLRAEVIVYLDFLLDFSNDFGGLSYEQILKIVYFNPELILEILKIREDYYYMLNSLGKWILLRLNDENEKTGFVKSDPIFKVDELIFNMITTDSSILFEQAIRNERIVIDQFDNGFGYGQVRRSERFRSFIQRIYEYLITLVFFIDNIEENGKVKKSYLKGETKVVLEFLDEYLGMQFKKRIHNFNLRPTAIPSFFRFCPKSGTPYLGHAEFLTNINEYDFKYKTSNSELMLSYISDFANQVLDVKYKNDAVRETVNNYFCCVRESIKQSRETVVCSSCQKRVLIENAELINPSNSNKELTYLCIDCNPIDPNVPYGVECDDIE